MPSPVQIEDTHRHVAHFERGRKGKQEDLRQRNRINATRALGSRNAASSSFTISAEILVKSWWLSAHQSSRFRELRAVSASRRTAIPARTALAGNGTAPMSPARKIVCSPWT